MSIIHRLSTKVHPVCSVKLLTLYPVVVTFWGYEVSTEKTRQKCSEIKKKEKEPAKEITGEWYLARKPVSIGIVLHRVKWSIVGSAVRGKWHHWLLRGCRLPLLPLSSRLSSFFSPLVGEWVEAGRGFENALQLVDRANKLLARPTRRSCIWKKLA